VGRGYLRDREAPKILLAPDFPGARRLDASPAKSSRDDPYSRHDHVCEKGSEIWGDARADGKEPLTSRGNEFEEAGVLDVAPRKAKMAREPPPNVAARTFGEIAMLKGRRLKSDDEN